MTDNTSDAVAEFIDESTARQLDSEIRHLAKHVHIAVGALFALVNEAKAGSIHKVLGFPSWTAYITDALDGQWKIERDKRGEVVRFLASQGMSQRAIAATTGIGKGTVHRELSGAPSGQVITGMNAKTYTRLEPQPEEESDEEWVARQHAELQASRIEHRRAAW